MENTGGSRPREWIGPVAVASISGAVGSLPLHLLPLIVTTMLIDGAWSVAEVGWVPAVLLIGQLSTSLLLPGWRIVHVSIGLAFAAAVMMQLGLTIANSTSLPAILLGWFVVGQSCGILRYLSTLTLASGDSRPYAFGVRLASVLVFASLVILALKFGANFGGYQQFVSTLQIVLFPVLIVTIFTMRPASLQQPTTPTLSAEPHSIALPFWVRISGLVVIFSFFLGQTGFLAYAFQQAEARGVAIEDVITAAVAMKLLAGVWLFVHSLNGIKLKIASHFAMLSAAVVVAMVAVSYSATLIGLLVGLVLYEIGLNTLSARLQSAVVARDPVLNGPWLNAAIMFGAAAGPPLNGYAISHDHGALFFAIAVFSALLPFIWQQSVPRPVGY